MIRVLLITNKGDVTTDFIVKKLSEKKIDYYRLNTEDLLSKNSLSFDFDKNIFSLFDKEKNVEINLHDIKSVYFRRPLMPHINEEYLSSGEKAFVLNEITFYIEGLYKILKDAFWISSVFSIREAESKIFQLQIAKELGFKVPKTLITNHITSAKNFIKDSSLIVKPIKTGIIEDQNESKLVFTSMFNKESDLTRITSCPTYFQDFIDKEADIRVTVVGNNIFPALIHSQEFSETMVDWRNGENLKLKYDRIDLPDYLKDLCIDLTKKLKLNFGAIDFVRDKEGNYFFLEINPNGQWAWIEKQLNYNISEAICNMLIK